MRFLHAGFFVGVLLLAGAGGVGAQDGPKDVPLAPPLAIIGTPERGPLFGFVADVCLVGKDTLAIVDSKTPSVFLVTLDGEVLGTVGREGLGPGEYVEPRAVTYAERALFVTDPRLSRITQFDLAGDLVGTYSVPGVPRDCAVYGDSLVVSTTGSPFLIQALSLKGGFEPRGLLRADSDILRDNPTPRSDALLELDKSMLYAFFRSWNKIAAIDLALPRGDPHIIRPSGPTIDLKREDFDGWVSSAAPQGKPHFTAFTGLSVLPTGHLVLQTAIPDAETPFLKALRGMIVDPWTGLEADRRIKPETGPWISFMWCLSNGLIAGLDTDSMQLRIYDLPQEILAVGTPGESADMLIHARGHTRWILILVALVLIIGTTGLVLGRAHIRHATDTSHRS